MPDKALKATSPEELSLDKLSLGNSQEDRSLSNPSSLNPPFKSRSFGSRLSENPSSRKPAPKKRAPKKNSGGYPPSPEDGFSKSSAPGTSVAETRLFENTVPENNSAENTALEKNTSENGSTKQIAAKKRKNKKRRNKKHATEQSSPEERPSWSMHPNLHDQVQEKLDEVGLIYTFEDQDDDCCANKTYDTRIMGSFICENKKCRKQGWDSKMIAITIREYWLYRYNARVYHQRCMGCGELGKLVIDEECYAERVSYRIKYWCDVSVKPPPFEGTTKQPHEEDWCEGCKHGRCKRRSGVPDRV
ncbi:uncharacterized protein FIESC28_08134 [Fusarium coffeatum]|uniref:3CxxC-type domain-containing protein n=1 Tax=Fusarium coffeatum TaxID=231269 RepID=A0A366RAZ1_9HYPO|nr:uncharacterized protein FIESC28_08134 [Fusarium coffeatum]RBR13506.1 hypothetical protein FIESC28_08134 [Fusarium coffeatum]